MAVVQRLYARHSAPPLLGAALLPPRMLAAAAATAAPNHATGRVQQLHRMSLAMRLQACKQVFQFRHFQVCQDGAAMKVGTDAMVLGSWAQPPASWCTPSGQLPQQQQGSGTPATARPVQHSEQVTGATAGREQVPELLAPAAPTLRVLDIGTGTGVLALMMAQTAAHRLQQRRHQGQQQQQQQQQQRDGGRCGFLVDALEIEAAAAQQAAANAAASPWGSSIHVHHTSLQDWVRRLRPGLDQALQANPLGAGVPPSTEAGLYHTIVCNPPFFVRSSKPQDAARALARHAESLPYEQLAAGGAALLHPLVGTMFVILPFKEALCFADVAVEQGLHVRHVLRVYSYAEDPEPVRLVLQLARHPQQQPLRRLAMGTGRVSSTRHSIGDPAVQELQGELWEQQVLGSACEPAAVEDLEIRQLVGGDAGRVAYTEQYRDLTADFHHPSAFRQ